MRRGARRVAQAAVGLTLAVVIVSAGFPATAPADPAARDAALRFLDRYVDDDGRVVRHDQGGDTVSEGQAYGMLLAAAIGDRERFDLVWRWTATHLRRPDGLLSWHWQDGEVVGEEPAADADLDAARALLLAADRFDAPAYQAEGLLMAAAVLAHETVDVNGKPVLVAGPWARELPYKLNPSYESPRSFAILGAASNDARWEGLRESSLEHVRALTTDGLPPDWADHDGTGVRAGASPDGKEPGYGFDAVRVTVRFAEDCDDAVRAVAGDLWPRLQHRRADHPAELVGAAAAADAAGDTAGRDRLLARAQRKEREQSTYYGAAWVALARMMLTTELLDSC